MNSGQSIEHDGHIIDILTNAEDTLRLMVSRNGAEPVSLARKNAAGEWIGFLYRDGDVSKNPHGWNNHSTVMGYYIHRLVNEVSDYQGHVVKGSTHSFIRHKTFSPPVRGEGSLSYHLSASEITPEEYPWQVDLTLTYLLSHEELTVRFHFQNREGKVVHISFGLHPGFGVTQLAEAVVHLPPGRYLRHLAPENFLSGGTQEIVFPGGPMPFPVEDLPGSFLLDLEGVPERVFRVEDPATGRKTTLDYQQAPYLTIWSDGGPFVCVEPCWGLPDHYAQRPFESKLGIQKIAALGVLESSFSIRPELTLPAE